MESHKDGMTEGVMSHVERQEGGVFITECHDDFIGGYLILIQNLQFQENSRQ